MNDLQISHEAIEDLLYMDAEDLLKRAIHDLKAPINVVQGVAEILDQILRQDDAIPEDELATLINIIEPTSERIEKYMTLLQTVIHQRSEMAQTQNE